MKIYKILLLSLCFMTTLYGQSTNGEEQNKRKYDDFVFSFTPERGDFVFIGIDNDSSGELGHELEIEPRGNYFFSEKMKKKKGLLELIIKKKKQLKNLYSDYAFQLLVKNGANKFNKYRSNFKTAGATEEPDKKIKHVEIKKTKHKVTIKHVQYYKIPYLETDKKTHFVVVIITKSLSDLKKLVHIPEAYLLFDWEPDIIK